MTHKHTQVNWRDGVDPARNISASDSSQAQAVHSAVEGRMWNLRLHGADNPQMD
jgi:hypothetical protein